MPRMPFASHPLGRRRFLLLSAATAAAPLLHPTLRLARAAADPVRIVLSNGLTVLIEERRSADTVAMQLTARAGARDDDRPGITIMTSRMMFQGTGQYASETELQRAAQAVGGTVSRGTTLENSQFAALVPARETEVAFDLLASLVLDPLFDADALERQKLITLQDLSERLGSAGSYAEDLFNAALFGSHPLSHPVIGTEDGIEGITRVDLLRTRDRQWGAANLVLTIVGRIGVDEALAKAEAYLGSLPAGVRNDRPATPLAPLPASQTVTGVVGQQQAQFRVGFAAPGIQDPDRYAMVVLTATMNGFNGHLLRELRSERGLVYFAGASNPTYSDAGAWYATAGVDPQNVPEALSIVGDILRAARVTPPHPAEVAGIAGEVAGRQILADETNSARAGRLASREILGSDSTEEFVRRMRQVTPADVQRVAERYLDPDKALVVIVGPDLR